MPPAPASDGAPRGVAAVPAAVLPVASFLLPAILRALSFTDRILDRDESWWMAAALRMRDADVPVYVAGWDTKPPLAFLFHRLALALAPDAPMLAAHVLGAIVAGAACALVACAARRLGGTRAGLLAAVLFALLDSTGPVRALAANTELLTYVPVALLTLAIATGRPRGPRLPFVVGALAAVAFLAKHPAALYAPLGCVAILAGARDGRTWLGTGLACLAGAASVLAVAVGWVAGAGAWDDFVACNVSLALHRAGTATSLARDSGWGAWLAVAAANPLPIAGVAAAAAACFAGRTRTDARRAVSCAGPLVAAGAGAALAGGAAFQHYLQMAYVPAAVLAGAGFAIAARLLGGPWSGPRSALVIAASAFALAAPDRLGQWRSRDWAGYDGGAVPAVRDRVQALARPGETMFVWGIHPDLYVTCRRAPATRFISAGWLVGTYTGRPPHPGAEPVEIVPGSWDLLFLDLESTRPAVVVDSAAAGVHGFGEYPVARFPRLLSWLESHYVAEPGPGGYVLWRRRD